MSVFCKFHKYCIKCKKPDSTTHSQFTHILRNAGHGAAEIGLSEDLPSFCNKISKLPVIPFPGFPVPLDSLSIHAQIHMQIHIYTQIKSPSQLDFLFCVHGGLDSVYVCISCSCLVPTEARRRCHICLELDL